MMRWILLSICLGVAGCGSVQSSSSVRIDPALAGLVPADTVFMAGIRMDELRTTPWYKKSGKERLTSLDAITKDTGVDFRRNLWELLAVSNGRDLVILARGRFADQGMEPKQTKLHFINPTTVVAGNESAVRTLLAQRGKTTGLPPALAAKVATVPAHSQLWMVGTGGFGELSKLTSQSGMMANLPRLLSMLDSAAIAADLRTGLNLTANGACRTDQNAKSLNDAMRGLVAMARLSVPDDQPELLKVFDAVQIQQQQRTVNVSVALTQEQMDALQAKFSRPKRP